MLSPKTSNLLLNISAVLVGLTVPSLFFGRAFIGVFLALAFILILISGNHKKTFQSLRPFLPHGFCFLIGLSVIGTSLNIPFSLRLDLSWEAWARTWLILFAIFYVLGSLQSHLDLILKSLAIGFFAILVLFSTYTILGYPLNKLVLNGLLLILPITLYQCFKNKQPFWMGIGALSLILYVSCAINRTSKASIAGLIFMLLSTMVFIGLTRFTLKRTLAALSLAVILITVGLILWLPGQLNMSSSANIAAAPFPVWIIDFHRQLIWLFSFDLAQESPWVGFGLNASNYHPSAYQTVVEYFGPEFEGLRDLSNAQVLPAHPHNWILEVFLDGGLLGLIPVMLCVICIFYISIKHYFRTQHLALLTFIAINIAYWGTGLLNFSFWSVWWQATYFLSSLLMFFIYTNRDKESR